MTELDSLFSLVHVPECCNFGVAKYEAWHSKLAMFSIKSGESGEGVAHHRSW